ncbi:hypothetical protein FRB99_003425, partial [Tulasnella sp. 403]
MVLVLAEVLSQAYPGTNNWLLPGMNQLVLSLKTPRRYTFGGLDAGGDAPSDTVVNALFKLAGARLNRFMAGGQAVAALERIVFSYRGHSERMVVEWIKEHIKDTR